MDAVQRQRAVAQRYGYLRTNGQVVVSGGPYITIMPVNPGFVVVPYYDPAVVFFAPRPGFVIGGAIRFGFGVTIGGFFAPWGWGGEGSASIGAAHAVFLNNADGAGPGPTAAAYVHPGYAGIRRPAPGCCASRRGACARTALGAGAGCSAARQGHASRNTRARRKGPPITPISNQR